ncbi:MAG: hypothetical protein P4L22_00680 [Candidatus Babeliales bacterium]|nr:hypothetical protein [Candidatus Babeliales bacterium]
MNIKSALLLTVFGFSLIGNIRIQALDKQKLLSRSGLASGVLISAVGLYSLGLVSTPKIAIKKYNNKILEFFLDTPKIDSYLNQGLVISGATLMAGLAVAGLSLKYLK